MHIPLSRYRDLLLTYLGPQKGAVSLLSVLLFVNIGLQLLPPQFVRSFVDTALTGGPAASLTLDALLYLGVTLVNQAFSVAVTALSTRIGWRATNALRGDLLRHCLRLDMPFHQAHTPGALIERIDGDVTALNEFFSATFLHLAGNVLLLAGVLLVVTHQEPRVGLAMTTFVAVALGVLARSRTRAVPQTLAERQASADLYGFLEERLAGLEDLRASGAGAYVLRRFTPPLRAAFISGRAATMVSGTIMGGTFILFAMGTALALGLGLYFLRAGTLSVGTVFLLFQYTQLLQAPLGQITRQVQDLQRAGAGLLRVQELLETTSALADGAGALPASGSLAAELEHVSFGYAGTADDERALHDVSFRLEAGRVLGVLGRTGSGKTTLTRLLLRLYDPAAGAVRLGAVDLRELSLTSLRGRIGIVTQDVHLFGATVRDNLTLFDMRVPDEKLTAALHDLGLGPWYAALPAGLDTTLAPNGLSAGEAQLLAFARVFLQNPGLVILDEASSRLDPATERLIEGAVGRLLQGRTGIIIAHRLATVGRTDDIIILEEGRIVEHGPRTRLSADPTSRFAGLLRHGLQEVLV